MNKPGRASIWRAAAHVSAHLLATGLMIWDAGAIYYCFGLASLAARIAAIAGFAVVGVLLAALSRSVSGWFLAVLTLWLAIPVAVFLHRSIDDTWQWQRPWARAAEIELNGSRLRIDNVRDFVYTTADDFEMRYTTLELDLDKIEGVLLGVSYWDGHSDIAHTMLGFYFSDQRAVVVSVETRKPVGASDALLAGIYRQYGVLPVFGTAHDLWKLRSDYRMEDLYVYLTNATAQEARQLLLALCRAAERQQEHPEFYNTLLDNCTSALVQAVREIRPHMGFDIRFLINGKVDEYAFENGWLMADPGDTFCDVRRRAKRVTQLVVAASDEAELRRRSGKDVLLDRLPARPAAKPLESGR